MKQTMTKKIKVLKLECIHGPKMFQFAICLDMDLDSSLIHIDLPVTSTLHFQKDSWCYAYISFGNLQHLSFVTMLHFEN